MAGIGTVSVVVQVANRAQWDAFIAALTTFKSNHPEVQSINFRYVEDTAA